MTATEQPKVPARYRRARHHVIDDAMPTGFSGKMGQECYAHRAQMVRGGDDGGVSRYNWELPAYDRVCQELAPFRARLVEALEVALEPCGVDDFHLDQIEINATLYHQGSHFEWHDDAPGVDGEFVPSRRITYCYYMASDPQMFSGGELEFIDGTTVEPRNNRLVLFHPLQQHRVRPVECWSREALHGRWALMGWLHGEAPEGYGPHSSP